MPFVMQGDEPKGQPVSVRLTPTERALLDQRMSEWNMNRTQAIIYALGAAPAPKKKRGRPRKAKAATDTPDTVRQNDDSKNG